MASQKQQVHAKFPPTLLSQPLNMVCLPPSLSLDEQTAFITSLQQHPLHDLQSFRHDYTKLIAKIDTDLVTLVHANFGQFWAYIQQDKTIIPVLQEMLIILPSYLPPNLQLLSFNHRFVQNKESKSSLSPLIFDKTAALLMYFESSTSKSNINNKTNSNTTTINSTSPTSLAQQIFHSDIIQQHLHSIYQHLILVFVRLSSHRQSLVNISQLSTKITKEFSSNNQLLSTDDPFATHSDSIQTTTTNNKHDTRSVNTILQWQHLELLTTYNIFPSTTLVNLIQFYGVLEPNITKLIILRLLQYIPIKMNLFEGIELSLYYIYQLEHTLVQNDIKQFYQQLNPQTISTSTAVVLENEDYIVISTFLQEVQHILTLLQSLFTIEPTLIGQLFNKIDSPLSSNLIQSLPQSQDDVTTHQQQQQQQQQQQSQIDPDDPFAALVSTTIPTKPKIIKKPYQLQTTSQYPQFLLFLIRLFDFTLPSIAQIMHIDILLTIIQQSDETISTTLSTTTSSTTTNSISSSEPRQWLHDTILGDLDTPFSNTNYRSHQIFHTICFDIIYLFTTIFNTTILIPLGLGLNWSSLMTLFNCNENDVKMVLGLVDNNNKLTTKSPLKTTSKFATVSLITGIPIKQLDNYIIDTDTATSTSTTTKDKDMKPHDKEAKQEYDAKLDQYYLPIGFQQIDENNTYLYNIMYQLFYTFIALLTPQYNPIDTHLYQSQQSSFTNPNSDQQQQLQLNINKTQYNNINDDNNDILHNCLEYDVQCEYAIPGSLLYYLPIYGLFDVLKHVHKVNSYNSSTSGKKRPVLPTWIPTSALILGRYIDSLIQYYSLKSTTPSTSNTTTISSQSTIIPIPLYSEEHFDQYGLSLMMQNFKKINHWQDVHDLIVTRLSTYESTCYTTSNEEYIQYIGQFNAQNNNFGYFGSNVSTTTTTTTTTTTDTISTKLLTKTNDKNKSDITTTQQLPNDDKKSKQSKTNNNPTKTLVNGIYIDTSLTEEEQFQQYLKQTGRTVKDNKPKGKQQIRPTQLVPLTAEEREAYLERYKVFASTYDDEYDDSLDDFRGLYSGINNVEDIKNDHKQQQQQHLNDNNNTNNDQQQNDNKNKDKQQPQQQSTKPKIQQPNQQQSSSSSSSHRSPLPGSDADLQSKPTDFINKKSVLPQSQQHNQSQNGPKSNFNHNSKPFVPTQSQQAHNSNNKGGENNNKGGDNNTKKPFDTDNKGGDNKKPFNNDHQKDKKPKIEAKARSKDHFNKNAPKKGQFKLHDE